MNSVWTSGTEKPKFPTLTKHIKTDVLIVGGGMAGLLCAYMLKEAGVDCVLAEAKHICSGVTQNTTAKITYQHGLLYSKLIKRFGQEKAALYLEAQSKACEKYAKLCRNIQCDFEQKDSFVYSLDNKEKIADEVLALRQLGADARFCAKTELPFNVAGAVRVSNQAQFHPLKFAYSVAGRLPVYENTKVQQLLPHKAITTHGEIDYKKLIVATHFPFINKHGSYFIKLYQHRSYVIALEDAQRVNGMYVDEKDTGLSFRGYKGLLLLGSGGHRTGKQGGGWKEIERFAKKHYPAAKPVTKWAAQDCITLDGAAYIGMYSKNTSDMFVATGFNKWGMSSSMVAAMILSDLVQGKNNKYARAFSPSRSILRPQLAVNAIESFLGLITPTAPRCAHLGCALKYNKQEHSWDCSCHGSRFDKNGKLLDNPATDDIDIKK